MKATWEKEGMMGKRESKRREGCQVVNPEVMNEPIIKCLRSDTLSVSLNQNTALSQQTSESSKIHTQHQCVASASYDSNTHQIKSAELSVVSSTFEIKYKAAGVGNNSLMVESVFREKISVSGFRMRTGSVCFQPTQM
ncbi:hypothetical protein KOW79_017710 [Hemibagrus wyckioides]|uniref:Uncharacterized protein n=1 Tax=Hemibagrus wyckioides TaxID=337641 RepID=A0A9D3SCB6_9TELE|nr:hypothetical protein KOW79_017710 [Hemibagrus wyckioides]